jgi:hypothetical protein
VTTPTPRVPVPARPAREHPARHDGRAWSVPRAVDRLCSREHASAESRGSDWPKEAPPAPSNRPLRRMEASRGIAAAGDPITRLERSRGRTTTFLGNQQRRCRPCRPIQQRPGLGRAAAAPGSSTLRPWCRAHGQRARARDAAWDLLEKRCRSGSRYEAGGDVRPITWPSGSPNSPITIPTPGTSSGPIILVPPRLSAFSSAAPTSATWT